MAEKKRRKEKRLNRPNWRKIRGYGKKMLKDRHGNPLKDSHGRTRFNVVKIKTKRWERVK